MFKTGGYLISSLSVFLLGIISWESTRNDPTMRTLLIAGMATSVLGMLCRWISFMRNEKPEKM